MRVGACALYFLEFSQAVILKEASLFYFLSIAIKSKLFKG